MLQFTILSIEDPSFKEVLSLRLVTELADLHLLLEEASAGVIDRVKLRFDSFLICPRILEYYVSHGFVHLVVHFLVDVGPHYLPRLLSPSLAAPIFAGFPIALAKST